MNTEHEFLISRLTEVTGTITALAKDEIEDETDIKACRQSREISEILKELEQELEYWGVYGEMPRYHPICD